MTTEKKKSSNLLVISVVVLFVVCCICPSIIAVGQKAGILPTIATDTPAPVVVATAPAAAASSSQAAVGPVDTTAPVATAAPVATDIPTTAPVGLSRDNPVPAGASGKIDGDMTLTVIKVTRPADSIVTNGNMFNTSAGSGSEYVAIDIQVVCNKASTEKCSFNSFDFKAVGADGEIHDAAIMLAGVDGLIKDGDFFGGGTKKGYLFFSVPAGDKSVVLFYNPIFLGTPVYFALQ